MRAIVCGGRDYDDQEAVIRALRSFPESTVIIHGAARGADRLAGHVAREVFGFQVEEFPADWSQFGKAAGPIRNQQMLDAGADVVVAFPGGRGTAHMVAIARKAGVPVLAVQP